MHKIHKPKIIGIIPARLASTRLPGKPLMAIENIPMVIHVLRRAELCKDLDDLFVATDSKEIFQIVKQYNGKAIMTSKKHKTGTDRIAEAVKDIDCNIVVDIQGDEPLLKPEHISMAIKPLLRDREVQVVTLMVETTQLNNPDEVKVVTDLKMNVMYFSRSDIPSTLRKKHDTVYKQYCILPFRKKILMDFVTWEQTPLEKIEYVECLRILEHGYKVAGVLIKDTVQSVDTIQDLNLVRKLMKKDKLKKKYITK